MFSSLFHHRRRAISAFCATISLLILGTLIPPFGGLLIPDGGDAVSAQSRGELGPPPVVTDPAVLQPTAPEPRAGAAAIINTSSRQAVVDAYNTRLLPALAVAPGWNGSIAGCVPGTTSAAYEAATLQAVNYFRAMAGLPDNVTLDSTFNSKDQQSALMTIAQGELTHSPPTSFACYTAGGAEAAGKSNLAIGAGGADAVDLYMEDPGAGNTAVGHRRWILYPAQRIMGTGSTSAVNGLFVGSNSLWVLGVFGQPPATPEFVAWPPPGFVPRQITYPRWSFAVNGLANFSSASVTMTRNGQPVQVNVFPPEFQAPNPSIGDNTIVWEPQGLSHPVGMQDTPYQITISNVIVGGTPRTYTYSVTVIDPATASVVTPTPTTQPSGGNFGGTGFAVAVSANGSVQQTWNGGSAQLGYFIYRLNWVTGQISTVPVGTVLGAGATSYTDTFLQPGGIYCYMLVAFSAGENRQSDILCTLRNTRTPTGAPEATLRLNQSNVASLRWTQPAGGGHTGYNVRVLVGAAAPPAPLGPTATGADVPINGLTCFQVDAVGRGSSDVLCAIPGASTV
jgi:hypothetical protein